MNVTTLYFTIECEHWSTRTWNDCPIESLWKFRITFNKFTYQNIQVLIWEIWEVWGNCLILCNMVFCLPISTKIKTLPFKFSRIEFTAWKKSWQCAGYSMRVLVIQKLKTRDKLSCNLSSYSVDNRNCQTNRVNSLIYFFYLLTKDLIPFSTTNADFFVW